MCGFSESGNLSSISCSLLQPTPCLLLSENQLLTVEASKHSLHEILYSLLSAKKSTVLYFLPCISILADNHLAKTWRCRHLQRDRKALGKFFCSCISAPTSGAVISAWRDHPHPTLSASISWINANKDLSVQPAHRTPSSDLREEWESSNSAA